MVPSIIRGALSAIWPPPVPLSSDAPSNHHCRAPKSFLEEVLWAEFKELDAALIAYLAEITERVIREEVHGETADVDEIDEPTQIGRR